MNEFTLALTSVTKKVEMLIQLHESLLLENERLKREYVSLNLKLNDALSELENTQKQNEALRLAGLIDGNKANGSQDLKKRVGELVREVDKCIALLNK
jgi:HAMP domain-containing protein